MKMTKSYSKSPSQSTYRNGSINVYMSIKVYYMSLALYCYVMRSAPHKDESICNAFSCMCGRDLQRFKNVDLY